MSDLMSQTTNRGDARLSRKWSPPWIAGLLAAATGLSILAGLSIRPDGSGAGLEAGWQASGAARPREALRAAARYLERQPSHASALRLAARSLSRLERYPQAEDYFR